MKIILSTLLITILAGCSSINNPHTEYHSKILQARMQACVTKEIARYAAIVEIAKAGDNAAKVAAIVSIDRTDKCQE